MRIFSMGIPNDRNTYGDNIATKKDDYVIIPETTRDKCFGVCSLLLVTWFNSGVIRTQPQTLQ